MMQGHWDTADAVNGKICRHEASGNDKSNRIWVYRNDLGEEFLDNGKYACVKKAHHDLRLGRVDILTEYTADGRVKCYEFSDRFQQENLTVVTKKLMRERESVEDFKKLYRSACQEIDSLKAQLRLIKQFIEKNE